MILAVTVVKAGGPGIVQAIFGVQLRQIGITIGHVKRLVKARFPIDVDRVTGIKIEDGTAIERSIVVAMGVRHVHRRPVAKPGQGRGDKAAFLFTKVAPVILMLVLADDPVGQPRAFDGAGDVKLAGTAAKAAGGGGNRAAEGSLRAFRDDVNQSAGVKNAVQRGGRAFQYFYAFGGGIKAARQNGTQTVGHD